MEENEITDRELLEIARRKREDIKTYRQQELKSDTPLDTLETVTKSMKAGNRHTKKQKSNRWEAPDREYIKIPNSSSRLPISKTLVQIRLKFFGS